MGGRHRLRADDFGVQPLRPRTIRMQVFPGDDIDNDRVRAMIDELAARGLVRIYTVEGVDYLSIVDWEMHQRVGKRARRRYPDVSSPCVDQGPRTSAREADETLSGSKPASETIANHSNPSSALRAPSPSGPSAAPGMRGEKEEERRDAIELALPIAAVCQTAACIEATRTAAPPLSDALQAAS